jgi:hypothetical protein
MMTVEPADSRTSLSIERWAEKTCCSAYWSAIITLNGRAQSAHAVTKPKPTVRARSWLKPESVTSAWIGP